MQDKGLAVADCELVFVFPDGRRAPGRVSVQQPKQIDEREAQCVLTLEGLRDMARPISGNDTLQALLLALRLAAKLIAAFEEDGGKVLYPTGEQSLSA